MLPVKFTSVTTAPVWTLIPTWTEFWGFAATNAEGAIYFLKLYWQGNTNLLPVVGTTVPSITMPIQTASTGFDLKEPLLQLGPLWYTVTKNAGDTDATALTTGGDVITLFVG
jgi:hypothetical protein